MVPTLARRLRPVPVLPAAPLLRARSAHARDGSGARLASGDGAPVARTRAGRLLLPAELRAGSARRGAGRDARAGAQPQPRRRARRALRARSVAERSRPAARDHDARTPEARLV